LWRRRPAAKIAYRKLTGTKPSRTLAMIRRKRRYRKPLFDALVQTIRAETARKVQ
jgi:hypothetical protein